MTNPTLDELMIQKGIDPNSQEANEIRDWIKRNLISASIDDLRIFLESRESQRNFLLDLMRENGQLHSSLMPPVTDKNKKKDYGQGRQPIEEPPQLNYNQALSYVSGMVRHLDASMVVANADSTEINGDFYYKPQDLDMAIKVCRRR